MTDAIANTALRFKQKWISHPRWFAIKAQLTDAIRLLDTNQVLHLVVDDNKGRGASIDTSSTAEVVRTESVGYSTVRLTLHSDGTMDRCPCRIARTVPAGWCAHRIAAALAITARQ